MLQISNYKKAIELADSLEDIKYIEEKMSSRLNRRKKEDKQIAQELEGLMREKIYSPTSNIIPFI